MKKIIKTLLLKAGQIFLPFFLIIFGVVIGLMPFFLIALTGFNYYWYLGLIVSIPVAIVIISIINNITEWDDIWNMNYINDAINEYLIIKGKKH